MNKKILILILLIIVIIAVIVFFILIKDNKKNSNNTNIESSNIIKNNETSNKTIKEENMDFVYIKVNNKMLEIELENNLATNNLKEKLKNGDIIIKAHEYGGFEKVGNLEFSLPRDDKNMKTSAGDIVLYQGNQISLFYNSNTWSYTKLGKIKDISAEELKNILGSGDVDITFTLSE